MHFSVSALLCLVAASVARPALGYYYYRTRVPNGEAVPHPCKPNFVWHGLGHVDPAGGGARNQFGLDFAAHNHQWTPSLCKLDSDGDGLTNGQELGDPDCLWKAGTLPARISNITHPGVCDPWGSDICRSANAWVSCADTSFQCDAINQPEVRNLTLRIPRTKVPSHETTYVCHVFEVPADQEYHIIANTPVIDNANVLHHMGIMECGDKAELTDAPVECGMNLAGCGALISIWTLGMSGQCLHENAGFRFGKGSYRRVALQYHWNNPEHTDTYFDSSGMTIFFTPKLRPHDAGIAIYGQEFLQIPPGLPAYSATGSCSSHCTARYMTEPMYITNALNHMHYLGNRIKSEVYRNGSKVRDVADDQIFGYDNPKLHKFTDPIAFHPGDEMRVTCQYSSLSKPTTTMWGESAFNEMCYVIMSYYPREAAVPFCGQWKDLDKCSLRDDGCDFKTFLDSSNPLTKAIIDKVLPNCNVFGSCRTECPLAVEAARNMSLCMQGKYWEYMKDRLITRPHADVELYKLVAAVDLCGSVAASQSANATSSLPPKPDCSTPQPQPSEGGGANQAGAQFMELVKLLSGRPLLQNIIYNDNRHN